MEVIVNGLKINYLVFGEGKPFLVLHGWGSNSDRWGPVAEQISQKRFKVIVPDLPGFGKSGVLQKPWNLNNYVNWAEQIIKEMNLGDFYLLGHSFGGALASKIAMKHNQEIKKLFLVSAACIRKKTAKKSFFAKISKIVAIFYFLPFYSFFRKAVYKFIVGKSDYLYVEGIMKETYLNVIAEDISFHLPFIKIPTVIIWGDKDEDTPLEEGHFISKQIKNSKFTVIPGAGHDLNRKQPEILSQKILDNLNEP
ncbi:MAG: alpha/beta hydrolase fold protein [Parcubacteria group bacterium Licking1014_1]|nr:MAG: alpha/beta hydrolase fold protein [Parcubacteria group bacterium Licking1014_1]